LNCMIRVTKLRSRESTGSTRGIGDDWLRVRFSFAQV